MTTAKVLGSVSAATLLLAAASSIPSTAGASSTPRAVDGRIAFVSYWAPNLEPQVYRLDLRTGRRQQLTFGPTQNETPVVSPDGETVLFRTSTDNFQTIWAMRPDGTGKHSLVAAGSVDASGPPAWSRDGRRVAFVDSLGRIAWLDLSTGAVHTLVPGDTPTWSPDGRTIAYLDGGAVMAIGADGTNERSLAPGVEYAYGANNAGDLPSLSWSPDGRSVAFAGAMRSPSGDVNGSQVVVAQAAGGQAQALTAGGDTDPQWSPNGSVIGFVRTTGVMSRVMVVRATGGRPVVVGRPPAWASDSRPVWSRDGRFIAVARTYDDSDRLRALVVIPRDGGAPRIAARFDPHSVWTSNETLGWSPDGEALYYSVGLDGTDNRSIYTIDPDGTALRRLTNAGVDDFDPAFSPDGETIVFVRTLVAKSGTENPELYLMNADGTDVRRLTRWPGSDLSPSWSPDGKRILFVRGVSGGFSLYTIRPNGTGLAKLGPTGSSPPEQPAWSPDGSVIVATRPGELALFSASGEFERDLVALDGDLASSASWSPAGDLISFIRTTQCSYCDESGDLWTVAPDGSNPQKVFADARDAAWSPDGKYFVVLRSDLLIVTSDGQIVRRLRATRGAGSEGLSWQRG